MPCREPVIPVGGPLRSIRRLAALAAGGAILGLVAAYPGQAADNGLTLIDAWMRVIVPARPAAGYFTLKNDGDKARALTGASSPACGRLMLHQSKTVNGISRMIMVKKVTVAAHGTLEFAPLGYHLMCMKPSADLKPGTNVPVTLHFADGATLTGRFRVLGPPLR
jgi:copper(I)-binding protein